MECEPITNTHPVSTSKACGETSNILDEKLTEEACPSDDSTSENAETHVISDDMETNKVFDSETLTQDNSEADCNLQSSNEFQDISSEPETLQAECLSDHGIEFENNSGVRKRKNVNIGIAEYTRNLDPKSSPARDLSSKRSKIHNILKSLSADSDVETLRQLAISRGGLLNNELRKRAWPILLGVDVNNIPEKPERFVLESHKDYEQVVLDVNRSLKRFPPGMDEHIRLSLQDQLVDCIMRVLVLRKELHYYQGYHDIVVTFLLVVGEDITVALMQQLSIKHLRDFMYENMEKTSGMLHFLYPLIGKCNSKVRKFMENAEVGTMFCLPWLITWYGHVLDDIKHIVRLYDFFIACHPLMPIYLAAAIVEYRGHAVLQCEPEMPFIHCLLSNIPDDLPFEQLILHAGDLFVQYPPADLEVEAGEEYEKYVSENKRKQEQMKQIKQARSQHQTNLFWPFNWGQNSHNISGKFSNRKSSILVKVTVWTGAALLSAAAVTLINSYYLNVKSLDNWMDIHWMWDTK